MQVTARNIFLLISLLFFLTAYNLIVMVNQVIAGPDSQASSQTAGIVMLDTVLADPEKYLDKEIVVEGVLQAAGKGFNRRFFLQDKEGRTLEVWPWAPLEVYHPPPSQKERPLVKPMGYFVGRHLRLTGRLQQQGERFVFQVSTATEL